MKARSEIYTLEEINSFFSLANKIRKMADNCVIWLIDDSENKKFNAKYSNNTSGNFSADSYPVFQNCHREGKYFTTDNYKTFWFLGLTANIDEEFSFSLAYNGNEEKIDLSGINQNDYKKIEEWFYFKIDKSLICTEDSEQQEKNLQQVVKDLLEKLIGRVI